MHDALLREWMQTSYGSVHYPRFPHPRHLNNISEIARALSRISRYGGHYREDISFYSVAEHCALMSTQVDDNLKRAVLLHDAHEAYSGFGDVIGPMKHLFPGLKEIEKRLDSIFEAAFSVNLSDPAIHEADMRMLATEKDQIMLQCDAIKLWRDLPPPYEEIHIQGLYPEQAFLFFMAQWNSV